MTITSIKCDLKQNRILIYPIVIILLLPLFLQLHLMFWSNAPKYFFQVDIPFFMQHTFSFLKNPRIEIYSLENLGESFKYHYGSSILAAWMSKITSLSVTHSFYILYVVTILLILRLLSLISINDNIGFILSFTFILVKFNGDILDPISFLYRNIKAIRGDYLGNLNTYIGLLIFTAIYYYSHSSTSKNRNIISFTLPSLLPIFKLPHFFFSYVFITFKITTNNGNLFKKILKIAYVSSIALFSLYFFYDTSSKSDIVKDFKVLDYESYVTIFALLLITIHRKKLNNSLLYLILSGFLLYHFFSIRVGGDYSKFYGQDFDQLIVPVKAFVILEFTRQRIYYLLNNKLQLLIYAYLVFISSIMIFNKLYHTYALLSGKYSMISEFVDNSDAIDALTRIPTANSVILTNNTDNPADGFIRKNRLLYLPGILGHQFFATNLYYGKNKLQLIERMTLQKEFFNNPKMQSLEKIKKYFNATHILIDKRKYFDTSWFSVNLRKIYENSTFIAYEL